MTKTIDPCDLVMAQTLRRIRTEELREAKEWIEKGDKDASWHWESPEGQPASLEGSYDFFLVQNPNPEDQTEDNIIHFCGQEIYDLWNDYPDDNIISRQNHCTALYHFIKEKLGK
jgi:hypothetical protein